MRQSRTTSALAALVLLALLWPAASFAGDKKDPSAARYRTVEVTPFAVGEGVLFPPDFHVRLTEELVKELQSSKRFAEVLREGEAPTAEAGPVLKLGGTVTEFKKGSQMKRYMIGFG